MDDSTPANPPRPSPHRHRADDDADEPTGTTRRALLIGGGAVGALVVGAAAGAVVAVDRRPHAKPVPNPAPRSLVAAAERERALIADLDATTGGSPAVRQVVLAARADHAEHLATFEALLRRYDPLPGATPSSATPSTTSAVAPGLPGGSGSRPVAPSTPSSSGTPLLTGTPRTLAQLAAAETRAASFYAQQAAAGTDAVAVLFASASAAETTHAGLLR